MECDRTRILTACIRADDNKPGHEKKHANPCNKIRDVVEKMEEDAFIVDIVQLWWWRWRRLQLQRLHNWRRWKWFGRW